MALDKDLNLSSELEEKMEKVEGEEEECRQQDGQDGSIGDPLPSTSTTSIALNTAALETSKSRTPSRRGGRGGGKGARGGSSRRGGNPRAKNKPLDSAEDDDLFLGYRWVRENMPPSSVPVPDLAAQPNFLTRETMLHLTSHVNNGFIYISHAFELIKQTQLELSQARQTLETIYKNQNKFNQDADTTNQVPDETVNRVDSLNSEVLDEPVPVVVKPEESQSQWNDDALPPEEFHVSIDPFLLVESVGELPENENPKVVKRARSRKRLHEAEASTTKQNQSNGSEELIVIPTFQSNYDSDVASSGLAEIRRRHEVPIKYRQITQNRFVTVRVNDVAPYLRKTEITPYSFSAKKVEKKLKKKNTQMRRDRKPRATLTDRIGSSKAANNTDLSESQVRKLSNLACEEVETIRKRKLPFVSSNSEVPLCKQKRASTKALDIIRFRTKHSRKTRRTSPANNSDDYDSATDDEKLRASNSSQIPPNCSNNNCCENDIGIVSDVKIVVPEKAHLEDRGTSAESSIIDELIFNLPQGKDMCECKNVSDSHEESNTRHSKNSYLAERRTCSERPLSFKVDSSFEESSTTPEIDNEKDYHKQSFSSGFDEGNSPVDEVQTSDHYSSKVDNTQSSEEEDDNVNVGSEQCNNSVDTESLLKLLIG